MSKRNGAARLGATGAVACALALGIAPAPSVAAETCPNAAIRAQQGATYLPECRAYEMVSPQDKNGNAIVSSAAAYADGGIVLYSSIGAFGDTPSNLTGKYRAVRTDAGWTSASVNPPTSGRNGGLYDQAYLVALNDDLSRGVYDTEYPIDPLDSGPQPAESRSIDIYRRDVDGSWHWLSRGDKVPETSTQRVAFGAVSDDFEVTVLQTRRAMTAPVVDESQTHVYARAGDTLRLVSVAPGGGPMPRGAVLGDGEAGNATTSQLGGAAARAVGADGRTIVFKGADASGVDQIFVRLDALGAAATTVHVSRAPGTGAGCTGGATFLAMDRAGETIMFGCPSQLTPDATPGGGVYAYDVATGGLRFLTPDRGGDVGPTTWLRFIGADARLSHVYFLSRGRLTDDARAASTWVKLYVLHDGVVRLAASADGAITSLGQRDVDLTEDGARLVVHARADLLTGTPTTLSQVYLYDAVEERLACVSCRADGSASEGAANLDNLLPNEFNTAGIPPHGNLSEDGRRVFFTSADALVPDDVNGVPDAYAYIDGRHHLLSSGSDPYPSIFAGASADGRDAFILTHESLVAQDIDASVTDLYALRVGGGFPASAPPPGCASDCEGPLRASPALPLPGTATFTGPGDDEERLTPHTAPVFRVAPIRARQRARWAESGRVTLLVHVSHAGRVRAVVRAPIGRRNVRVAVATRRASEGGTVRVPLRLSRRARAHLRRKGALRVRVGVSYSRQPGAETASLVLRTTKARGGSR